MKQKISITIDEEKITKIDNIVKQGKFRNRSHILEYSIDKFMEKENGL